MNGEPNLRHPVRSDFRPPLRCQSLNVGAVLAKYDQVLDSDAEPVGQIDSRLDRDDGFRWKRILGGRGDARPFMGLQTDAVSQSMREGFSVALLRDHISRQCIEILRCHAGMCTFDGLQLGLEYDVIYHSRLVVGFAYRDSSRHI